MKDFPSLGIFIFRDQWNSGDDLIQPKENDTPITFSYTFNYNLKNYKKISF